MEIRLFPLALTKMPLPNEWNTKNNLPYEDWKNNIPLVWINKLDKQQTLAPDQWKGIGIVCGGECPVVFDFDSEFPLKLLEGMLPPTVEQNTPSGGKHLFYQPEIAILESFSQAIPNMDVRATARSGAPGGQAVIYDQSILEELPNALPVPEWSFTLFNAFKKSDAIKNFIKELASGQGIEARNSTFFGEFGVPLAAFGVPEDAIIKLLINANNLLPNPMEETELNTVISNVLKSDARETGITQGKNKTPLSTVIVAIQNKYQVHSDARSGMFYFDGHMSDIDYAAATVRLETNFPKALVTEALVFLSHKNQIDYISKYLSTLPEWDGQDRIKEVVTFISKDRDSTLPSKIALFKKWMMGAFSKRDKRTPGHKLFLVLVGEQNAGKSALLANLAPPHRHTESVSIEAFSGFASKDAWATIDQCMICEFAEMVGNSRKNQNALKNLISSRGIVIRKPYKRSPERINPICIFAGTTNEWDTIRDLTGSARFVTIAVGDCIPILDMVREQRDQIWAQIAHLYDAGESWVSTPEELETQTLINEAHTHISTITVLYMEKLQSIKNQGKLIIRARDLVFAVCGKDSLTSLERTDLSEAKRATKLTTIPILAKKKIDGKTLCNGRYYVFQEDEAPTKPSELFDYVAENPHRIFDIGEGI